MNRNDSNQDAKCRYWGFFWPETLKKSETQTLFTQLSELVLPLYPTHCTQNCAPMRVHAYICAYICIHKPTQIHIRHCFYFALLELITMSQKSNFLGMFFIAKNNSRPQHWCQNPIVSDKVLLSTSLMQGILLNIKFTYFKDSWYYMIFLI